MLTIVPALRASDHVRDGRLHEEEGGAQVDGDVRVEQFRGRVQQRPSGRQAGGVDEGVDAPVSLDGAPYRILSLSNVGNVGPEKPGVVATELPQLSLDALAHILRRPVTTTVAPELAAARATPAPTPCVPPLTRTTLPCSDGTIRSRSSVAGPRSCRAVCSPRRHQLRSRARPARCRSGRAV